METDKRQPCGKHAVWSYKEETGRLTVAGTGAMEDFVEPEQAPWNSLLLNIKEVVIQEGITTVGDYAFVGCANLKEVTLSGTVEIVGVFSFSCCTSLEEITIPEGVKVLASKAFQYCSGLKKVSLPSTLTDVDMRVFGKCESLEEVIYGGTQSQWEQIRISRSASDNQYLVEAKRLCLGKQETELPKEKPLDRYGQIILKVREVLDKGGDGRFYILAPKLWEPGIRAKSGDSTLLIFPDGQTMLIDAGFVECGKHVVSLLKDLHLTSLDAVVLSHSHDDHAGGLQEVAEFIYSQKGGCIGCYYRCAFVNSQREKAFFDYIRAKGARTVTDVKEGFSMTMGGVDITVYNPGETQVKHCTGGEEELNNLSLLMKFTYGKSAFLTSGDLYRKKELELIARYGEALKADVMKANHHGAHTSNSMEWVDAIAPSVIYACADDMGSTPFAWKMEERQIRYYSTCLNDLLCIRLDKEKHVEVLPRFDQKGLGLVARQMPESVLG